MQKKFEALTPTTSPDSAGACLIVFRHRATYKVFSTLSLAGFLFVPYFATAHADSSSRATAALIALGAVCLWAVYFASKMVGRLTVYEMGVEHKRLRGTRYIQWSDVKSFHANCSVTAQPSTLLDLTIRSRSGQVISTSNDWNPITPFELFISRIMQVNERPLVRMTLDDLIPPAGLTEVRVGGAMVAVVAVLLYPMVLMATMMSSLSPFLKTGIIVGMVAFAVWFMFFRKPSPAKGPEGVSE